MTAKDSPKPRLDGLMIELAQTVNAASDQKFLQALMVFDAIAETPEAAVFFGSVRPRLQRLRPNRPLTLKRQFCQPFADLLHDGAVSRPARVARGEIDLLWQVPVAAAPAEIQALQQELAGIKRTEPARLFDLSLRLWRLAAQALGAAAAETVPSLPTVRAVLAVAPEIEAFKQAHPVCPMITLEQPALERISATLRRLQERKQPIEGYLLVVARRLQCPEQLVVTLQAANVPVPVAIARRVDELAVDEIATRSVTLAASAETLQAGELARELDTLTHMTVNARGTVGAEARTALGRGTAESAAQLKAALKSRILDEAGPMVSAALAAPNEAGSWDQAEQHAKALRQSRLAAKELGLGDVAEATAARISHQIGATLEGALDEMERSGAADPERPVGFLYRSIRMLEIVAGSVAVVPHLARLRRAKVGAAR